MNYCEFYLLGTCWQGKKRVGKCGDDRDKDRYKGILSKWILLAGYLLNGLEADVECSSKRPGLLRR